MPFPFWTSVGPATLSPVKKDQFVVTMDAVFLQDASVNPQYVWWAKSVQKPAIDFEPNAGPQANNYIMGAGVAGQKLGYVNPGGLQKFKPITLTLIDPNGDITSQATQRIMQFMYEQAQLQDYYGLENATRGLGGAQTQRGGAGNRLNSMIIEQLTHRSTFNANAAAALGPAQVPTGIEPTRDPSFTREGVGRQANRRTRELLGLTGNMIVSQRWELYQPHILSVNFGDLSYSEDGFVEITISVGYTGFSVDLGQGANIRYTFGNDPRQPTVTLNQ